MEKKFEIRTKDEHIVFGTLNSPTESSDKLIIFVHGMTGGQREHQYFNAAPFFNSNDFNTFRFDFYSKNSKSRQLDESSISTHVSDLEDVINFFKEQYSEIVLIGHSLGCVVILNSNLSGISKIVMWDPGTTLESIEQKNGYYESKLDLYVLEWGKTQLISPKMVEEWKSMVQIPELIKKINLPCKFIYAELAGKFAVWNKPILGSGMNFEQVVINGATHCFDEEGTEEKLFEETLKFIN